MSNDIIEALAMLWWTVVLLALIFLVLSGCSNPLCGYNTESGCGYIGSNDRNMLTMDVATLEREAKKPHGHILP